MPSGATHRHVFAPVATPTDAVDSSPFHVFGIRHHGPGCARSLLAALTELQPDCLLLEGPPDAEAVLPLALDPAMAPPLALLVYDPADSRRASFFPFAEFSPEWQALRYGLQRGIPTRFIDLPIAHQLGLREDDDADADEPEPETAGDRGDPLDWLARAAGHGDGEAWWNHLIEERQGDLDVFAAIGEAMQALRAQLPERTSSSRRQAREQLREAYMRKCLRQAQKDGFTRIAVVCGAWHQPALVELPSAASDNALLKGLPKTRVAATWVPWSYQNLTIASGYGAGVASPQWYEYLWRSDAAGARPEQRVIGWLAKAARLFREHDLDCSSAHVIEAARLADTLAALRERPRAGLDELQEALLALVCLGDPAPLQLIHRQLIVGERQGQISPAAPALPLQRDLEAQQKSLRLKPSAAQKTLDLDLRQANDLARSHLLHRLALLEVHWGRPVGGGRSAKGSFHEVWALQWQPELALAVIDASRWGTTLADAACRRAVHTARAADALPELARLVERVLLADLQAAMAPVARALEDLSAQVSDVGHLLAAIPPLGQIARYGNVRNTDTAMVQRILQTLVPRAAIGLPGACSAVDDATAQSLREQLLAAHHAVRLLGDELAEQVWLPVLRQLARREGVHGLLAGLACRLLFDAQAEDLGTTAHAMRRALSSGNDPGPAAAWLEGFLNQNAMVLLHDAELWQLLDAWLRELTEAHFTRILPLLRRTFADFNSAERRQLGEWASRPGAGAATTGAMAIDLARADQTVPLLRALLGLNG